MSVPNRRSPFFLPLNVFCGEKPYPRHTSQPSAGQTDNTASAASAVAVSTAFCFSTVDETRIAACAISLPSLVVSLTSAGSTFRIIQHFGKHREVIFTFFHGNTVKTVIHQGSTWRYLQHCIVGIVSMNGTVLTDRQFRISSPCSTHTCCSSSYLLRRLCRIFKITVLNQLRIQPAIGPIIDILKENTWPKCSLMVLPVRHPPGWWQ